MFDYINKHYENSSQFIREAIREKIESEKKKTEHELTFVEIRAKNQYTFYSKLDNAVDEDTLELAVDLGFFITINIFE